MSAFSQKEAGVGVETKEDAEPAPSTPVTKEGGSSTDQAKGDCMVVDDVKQQPATKEDSGATPTSDAKAGGKSSSGKKRGAVAFSAKGSDVSTMHSRTHPYIYRRWHQHKCEWGADDVIGIMVCMGTLWRAAANDTVPPRVRETEQEQGT